ncbi:hypothetical protein BGZ89_006772, partial [Linnemannia elongata]
ASALSTLKMKSTFVFGYCVALLLIVTTVSAMDGLRCKRYGYTAAQDLEMTKKLCTTHIAWCYGKAMDYCMASTEEVNDKFIDDCITIGHGT